jgi:uncharacterized membrane protein
VHFIYLDWDQALISQSLWNLLHGKLYISLYGYKTFGDHSTFINLLFLPLFAVFQHPLTMSFLEIFLFSASALLLYFMVLEELGDRSALLIMFAYMWFPANFFAMCHDFNAEAMTPFFILLVIWFYRKKQVRNFYLSFLFLFLFKENMPMIIAMIGLWGIFSKDRSRIVWGVIPIVLSVFYFIIMVKWVIPYFLGMKQDSLWTRYGSFGSSPGEIGHHLLQYKVWMGVFFKPINVQYILNLFGILLVPALFSPSLLLLISPIIMYHLISYHSLEKSIYFYYGAALAPVIFLAAVQTLKKFKVLYPLRRYICWIFVFGCCFQLYENRMQINYFNGFSANSGFSKEWTLVKMIPPDAGVIATFRFLPALSLRENLFSFHKVYLDEYQDPKKLYISDFNTGKVFKLPDNVSYALIDVHDSWITRNWNPQVGARIKDFLKGWKPIDSIGSVTLYTR